MGDINEVISVDAGPGIAGLKAFTDALEQASAKYAAFEDKLKAGFSGGAAGPDKLVAAWDKAAASISASMGKISESGAKLADLGAARGGAGPGRLAASWDKAAASISASIDKVAASGAKLGDLGTGADAAAGPVGKLGTALDETAAGAGKLGGALGRTGDGLKGVGDSAKASEAFLSEFNATMAETIAMEREAAAASADASAKIAAGQRLNTASARQASTDAVAAQRAQSAAAKQAVADAEVSQRKYQTAALVGAAAVGYGIYKAAQLQTQVTKLYTSAGESQKNLPMMTQGILGLSGPTATSQSQLASGAYMIESAGFHGKDALTVLRAAAQGAQAEGAPLGEVGNALTSVMNAYGMKPSQATSAMNQIITMVGSGKMTMAGAVSALPTLLPAASAAHLSFGQAAGALATMTATGMSPDLAAQHLQHTIGALQGPNAVQSGEMYMLGLDPVKLAKNLGKTGLTGTVSEIQAAVASHTDKKTGLVDLNTMNASKAATQDALTMLHAMPPALQKLGRAYLDNGLTTKQWMTDLKGLPPLQANLAHQFGTVANLAHGFNSELKAGHPVMQTSSAALSKLLGGTVGFQTFVALSGQHLATFKQNAAGVSQAAKDAGMNVKGWGDIQKTFNYQLHSFQYSAEAAATTVGAALLPAATGVMSVLAKGGGFLAGHKTLTMDLALAGGAVGVLALGKKIAQPITTALQMAGKVGEVLKIPGLDKLANIGKGGGATGASAASGGLDKVGAAANAAAGALDKVGAAGGTAAAGEKAAGEAGYTAASGERAAGDAGYTAAAGERAAGRAGETAAGAGGLGGLKGIGSKVMGAALIASIAIPIAQQLNQYINGKLGKKNPGAANVASAGTDAAAGAVIGGQVGGPFGALIGAEAGLIFKLATQSTKQSLAPVAGGNAPRVSPTAAGMAFAMQSGQNNAAMQAWAARMAARDHPAVPAPTAPQLPAAGYTNTSLRAGAQIKIPAPQVAKPKVPAPDLSSFNAAMATAMHKPAKLPPPDVSALTGAKGKAEADAKALAASIQAAVRKPAKVAAPDLSAAQGDVGRARAVGQSIAEGLAGGIRAGIPDISAAAAAASAAAAVSMAHTAQTRSPSRVTYKIGQDVGKGFEHGLRSRVHHVKHAAHHVATAAVHQLSASAAASLRTGLLGGQSAVDAVMTALGKGPRPQDIQSIDQNAAKLISQVPKGHSALVAMLKADNATLDRLAAKRAVLMAEITDAQQITTSAISSASIVTAASGSYAPALAASNGPIAASQTIQGLQYMAGDQSQFAGQMAQLKKAGLNATSLDQLTQAGAQQGIPVAMGLLQGGPGAIKQVNQLEKSVIGSAGKLGDAGGPAMYQAGVDAGNAAARGLKSQAGTVESVMSQIAGKMVGALKSVLGHSATTSKKAGAAASAAATAAPSPGGGAGAASVLSVPSLGKLAQMGNSAATALARDVTEGNAAASALGRLASAANRAASGHPGGHTGSHGGGGPVVINYHYTYNVTVQGSVTSEADLLDRMQELQLAKADRNWQGGWQHPGRAG